jgi:hypothetical protein
MNVQVKEQIQDTPLYQAMVNVGYFPVWSHNSNTDEWEIDYWSIPYAPLPLRIRQLCKRSGDGRVIQNPYEDCDLHRVLMNTGYEVRRENYYINGKDTGKFVDYYKPAYDPNKMTPGCVRDWSAEPRYVRGRGGYSYPAEFVAMFPYTYGGW